MQVSDLKNLTIMSDNAKAKIVCYGNENKVIWSQGLPIGQHRGKDFIKHCPPGSTLEVENATGIVKETRLRPLDYGEGANETGANPDFKVTSATRNAREMQRTMRLMQLKSDKLERKMAEIDTLSLRREASGAPDPADLDDSDVLEPVEATEIVQDDPKDVLDDEPKAKDVA